MRIVGRWLLSEDGIWRPVFDGKIRTADGTWQSAPFLLDSGADRTVLTAETGATLRLPPITAAEQLSGFGGAGGAVRVVTSIQLPRDDGGQVVFNGPFTASTDLGTIDMCLLGRDITDFFAVIVDRPGSVVCLLGQHHRYVIQPA